MKREERTVLGIPMTVVDEEAFMAETGGTGEHIYLVVRVADAEIIEALQPPWPALEARRFKVRCIDCRELCWCDPKSNIAPGLGQIVCMRCLLRRNGREDSVIEYDAEMMKLKEQNKP